MPTYCYRCENCEHQFEEFLSVSNRKNPELDVCVNCGKHTVKSIPALVEIFSDSTLTPDKKTKGDWGKLMTKMKKGLPKRTHETLDRATSRNSRRYRG